eukprot:1156436-Pelagomonas_calceolata.AAC.2
MARQMLWDAQAQQSVAHMALHGMAHSALWGLGTAHHGFVRSTGPSWLGITHHDIVGRTGSSELGTHGSSQLLWGSRLLMAWDSSWGAQAPVLRTTCWSLLNHGKQCQCELLVQDTSNSRSDGGCCSVANTEHARCLPAA